MLINTVLDTEDFVHLYYPEDDVPNSSQGCGAGARRASKYQNRPPTPEFKEVNSPSYAMCSRPAGGGRGETLVEQTAPSPVVAPTTIPRRVRASEIYPRLRLQTDEPDLKVPFATICGEFVQYLSRTSEGSILALSNYRLYLGGVSVPTRLIDTCEIKDLLYLYIQCKDGRSLKCTFNNGIICAEWSRRLTVAIATFNGLQDTFAAAYYAWALEAPLGSPARRLLAYDAHTPHQRFRTEVERLGFLKHGAWRVSAANASYKLCPSYPPYLIVPGSVGDEDLDNVAKFRAARRIPAVIWRHRGNGAILARSSQPEVGWLGWRSSEDESLLAALAATCALDRAAHSKSRLLIVDARSYTSAVTNRARGGGCECPQYYPGADIQFMCLPNIHNVRKSFQQLRQLASEPPDQPNWNSGLDRSLWLQYISGLGRTAGVVARALLASRPVLVHCSDGWDRTPQVTASAQLLLDPYYRTIEGFRVLIEREWLDFGHKFADRCGHTFGYEEPNERSPIFIQWLDLVHQMMLQYPCSFEFTEAYLIKLVTHAHSCMFGTFLCNNPRERRDANVSEQTCSVWPLLDAPHYKNHLYSPPQNDEVLSPEYSVRSLQFWSSLYIGDKTTSDDLQTPSSTNGYQPHITSNGVLSKTRSCDNLTCDSDRPQATRRCSDPNLCPELVVSLVIGRDDASEKTDFSTSASDLTAASSRNYDQVDGMNMHHFENARNCASRDMTSNSSSLERELESAVQRNVENIVENVSNNNTGSSDETNFLEESCFAELNLHNETGTNGRARHISITWRSVSESSHQTDSSAGFDLGDMANHNSIKDPEDNTDDITLGMEERTEITPNVPGIIQTDSRPESEVSTKVDSGGSTRAHSEESNMANDIQEGQPPTVEVENSTSSTPAETECSSRESSVEHAITNGINHSKMNAAAVKLLEVELGNLDTNGITGSVTTNGGSTVSAGGGRGDEKCMWWSEHTLCGNGANQTNGGGPYNSNCDADGLPALLSPVQKRLHQMCMQQRAIVDELQSALAAALRARVPSPETQNVHNNHVVQEPLEMEIEMGIDAGSAWNSDINSSARCSSCRNQFWFARRKHHCRWCGHAICSSCSCSSVEGRICRNCSHRS